MKVVIDFGLLESLIEQLAEKVVLQCDDEENPEFYLVKCFRHHLPVIDRLVWKADNQKFTTKGIQLLQWMMLYYKENPNKLKRYALACASVIREAGENWENAQPPKFEAMD